MRVEDLENRAAESLAGRAAEQVLLGDTSLGSGGGEDSDLAQATKVAAMIDTQFAGNGSLLWLGEDAESLLRMRPDVARAVSERLNRIYEGTLSLVARNRSEMQLAINDVCSAEFLLAHLEKHDLIHQHYDFSYWQQAKPTRIAECG